LVDKSQTQRYKLLPHHILKLSIQGHLVCNIHIHRTPDLWCFVKLARLLTSLSREGRRQNGESFGFTPFPFYSLYYQCILYTFSILFTTLPVYV
jgi:hypothetical protein